MISTNDRNLHEFIKKELENLDVGATLYPLEEITSDTKKIGSLCGDLAAFVLSQIPTALSIWIIKNILSDINDVAWAKFKGFFIKLFRDTSNQEPYIFGFYENDNFAFILDRSLPDNIVKLALDEMKKIIADKNFSKKHKTSAIFVFDEIEKRWVPEKEKTLEYKKMVGMK